jgi:hypothetical protein
MTGGVEESFFKITAMGEEEEFPERWRVRADFTALLG